MSRQYGYEDDRFENAVSASFHCPICLNILKEPKMCRRNQHVFCSACIERHLQNSATCPECMEELTVDTLNQTPRVLVNCLSELNINCDYFTRGCRDFVQLGDLQTHVMNCGFAPVNCSNDGCAVVVNKRDQIHHETEVCELRKVRCHDCGEIRAEIEELKINQAEMKINQAEMKEEMKEELTQVRAQMKVQVDQLIDIKDQLTTMKDQLTTMKDQLNQVTEIKEQLPSLKEDVIKEVRSVIGEVIAKFYHGKQAIPATVPVEPIKQDIVVAGGGEGRKHLNSVETFSWNQRMWAQLPALKEPRSKATSFVYGNQIILTGGHNGGNGVNDMEMMKIDEEPLQWVKFPAKLPAKFTVHKTVVYKDSVLVVGGFNWSKGHDSDAIHEVLLTPPYSTKLLCRIPEPRRRQGTELINDKVFILGGVTNCTINSVIMYHIIKNECKQMRALPYAVRDMATVSWRNKVILMGGMNEKDQILNDVVMYDTVTGESEMLPSMKYKRKGCSAVITANVIVVMGGCNEKNEYLSSVECFTVGSNSWQELPPMIEARGCAAAVVKPDNFD